MSRRRVARDVSVSGLNNTAESSLIDASPTRFEQRSHNGTHHIPEETICSNGKHICMTFRLLPLGTFNPAEIGLHVGVNLAEAGKVTVFL